MEWVSVAALLGLMILLINLSAKSSFAKNQKKKALKSARDWAKKNPKKVRRAKNIDKKVDSTFFLIFKIKCSPSPENSYSGSSVTTKSSFDCLNSTSIFE